MSVEGMLGNDRVFAADLQALRPHRGQGDSAANIARMLKDSGLIEAGRPGSTVRVQDAYSLRCTPQVHGAARDTVEYAASVAGVDSPPPSITRALRWTAVWSPTATSMARRWPMCSISWRFRPPT